MENIKPQALRCGFIITYDYYLSDFVALHGLHSIWPFDKTVWPPLTHGIM